MIGRKESLKMSDFLRFPQFGIEERFIPQPSVPRVLVQFFLVLRYRGVILIQVNSVMAKWPHLSVVTVVYLWLNVSKYRLHLIRV